MKSKKSGPKVALDEAANEAMQAMLAEIVQENEFAKINLKKLNSWIVEWFYKSAFSAEKEAIAKAHFNRRDYLNKALKAAQSDEEVDQILEVARAKSKASQAENED